MRRTAAYIFVAAFLLGSAANAHATILTFDLLDPIGSYPEGFGIQQEYGDGVTATSGRNSSGYSFSYGVGAEGFTPNIDVLYGPASFFTGGPSLWRYDYGDLTNVLYQGSDGPVGNDYDYLSIQ